MPNQWPYQLRVTKYNPANRDANGYYAVDEWISPSDIGGTFNGELLTLEHYLNVEQAYIDTIMSFLEECQVETMRMFMVEHREIDSASSLYEQKFNEMAMQEDKVVQLDDVPTIGRMVLRDFAYCQLVATNRTFIHFGWDYYMYIGTVKETPYAIASAKENGLFAECYPSPYQIGEEDIIRTVEWGLKEEETIVGDEEVKGILREELQRALKLSNEHPVTGSFSINASQKEFFQRYLKHEMDFEKYDYYLWGGN